MERTGAPADAPARGQGYGSGPRRRPPAAASPAAHGAGIIACAGAARCDPRSGPCGRFGTRVRVRGGWRGGVAQRENGGGAAGAPTAVSGRGAEGRWRWRGHAGNPRKTAAGGRRRYATIASPGRSAGISSGSRGGSWAYCNRCGAGRAREPREAGPDGTKSGSSGGTKTLDPLTLSVHELLPIGDNRPLEVAPEGSNRRNEKQRPLRFRTQTTWHTNTLRALVIVYIFSRHTHVTSPPYLNRCRCRRGALRGRVRPVHRRTP